MAALGLTQYLIGPLSWIGATAAELARCRASSRRIADILDGPGGLHIAGLTHGPLQGFDLAVRHGELVGLVVADPAAVSALLACLALAEAPAAGHVAVRGRRLAQLDLDEARSAVLVAAHGRPSW